MPPSQAELRDTREVLPGQWLQTWHAPWVAAGVRPGQFVQLRTPGHAGQLMRRPFVVTTNDRARGEVSIHIQVRGDGAAWLAGLRPSDRVDFFGPLGRGYQVDTRTRHLLLVAAEEGIAGVRSLVDEALAEGRQVALLFGAPTAAQVFPSSLLPDELEYVVATEDGSLGHRGLVTDLVPDYEAWADQAFASGPLRLLDDMARLASGRDARLGVARLGRKGGASRSTRSAATRRRAWLQVGLQQSMGCAAGACLGCVVPGAEGPVRLCREGPVFAANELAWPEAR